MRATRGELITGLRREVGKVLSLPPPLSPFLSLSFSCSFLTHILRASVSQLLPHRVPSSSSLERRKSEKLLSSICLPPCAASRITSNATLSVPPADFFFSLEAARARVCMCITTHIRVGKMRHLENNFEKDIEGGIEEAPLGRERNSSRNFVFMRPITRSLQFICSADSKSKQKIAECKLTDRQTLTCFSRTV